jgi:hypothetical protein
VRILVNESGACPKTARDNVRLDYLLQEIDHNSYPEESESRPVTSRSVGQTSLRLERISLHSRHSEFPPDVENILTDRSDPGEGCSDRLNGNVTYHNHGRHRPSRISLELPILNPLPNNQREQRHDRVVGSGRIGPQADDASDDDISIISQYSLSPRGDNHSTERFCSSSPIVVGSPSGGASSMIDLSSSLSLPHITARSPSPGNPDRTLSYDIVNKPGLSSPRERHSMETPGKGRHQRSNSASKC